MTATKREISSSPTADQYFCEKEDLVEAWFDRTDQATLKEAEKAEFLIPSTRECLHRLIMTWLEALVQHRRVTKQMIFGKFEPGHLPKIFNL